MSGLFAFYFLLFTFSPLMANPSLVVTSIPLKEVKILLSKDKPRAIVLRAWGEVYKDGALLMKSFGYKSFSAHYSKNGIMVNERLVDCSSVEFKSTENAFMLDGVLYGGSLIVLKKNGHLYFINKIGVEDYIKAVVASEISPNWPLEAVCAQTIATRTYTIFKALLNKKKDWHFTLESQAYKGAVEGASCAIPLQIMLYKRMIFPAYYHSSCGGMTQQAGTSDFMPVSIICPYCRDHSLKWDYSISRESLVAKLKSKGIVSGPVESISVSYPDAFSMTPKSMDVATKDKILHLDPSTIRRVLGAANIKSTTFSCWYSWGRYRFKGQGNGHGLGMCQWGSKVMAQEGFSYGKILSYYYPQTTLSFIQYTEPAKDPDGHREASGQETKGADSPSPDKIPR